MDVRPFVRRSHHQLLLLLVLAVAVVERPETDDVPLAAEAELPTRQSIQRLISRLMAVLFKC